MSIHPLRKGEISVIKTVRFSETDIKKLDFIAEKEGIKRSTIIQTEVKGMIENWEKKHGKIKV